MLELRKLYRLAIAKFPQHRELVHDLFDTLPHPCLVRGRDPAEFQIVVDRELRDDIAALRHIGDAVRDHLARLLARDVASFQQDFARLDIKQPEHGQIGRASCRERV